MNNTVPNDAPWLRAYELGQIEVNTEVYVLIFGDVTNTK